MYDSTYRATYVGETQMVLLEDVIMEGEYKSMEFVLFRRMTEMVFGDAKAKKIITALCSYTKLVINWSKARVAVTAPVADLSEAFFKDAFSVEAIEAVYHGSQTLDFDRNEFDRNLMGIA